MNEETLTLNEDQAESKNSEEILENVQIPEATKEAEPVKEESEALKSTEEEVSVEELKAQIAELEQSLSERQLLFERMSREIGEFEELFPERELGEIPDSVWENVRKGIPLAASYALYERKCTIKKDYAERVNTKNSESSTGSIGKYLTDTFYTPDEVRAMSRSEIKANYSKILESMQKWT